MMKTLWPALLAVWVVLPSARAADTAVPPRPLTIAVFDFEAREELGKDFGREAAALVGAQLSGNPGLWVVERAELDRLLGEQALGLGGAVLPETAAKTGQLLGAKALVTGRAFRAGGELVLTAKLMGTETSRVYGEVVKGAQDTPLTALAGELAQKLAATATAQADTLCARAVPREDRVAALKAVLKDAKRPSVSVKILERHFGSPTIDPAAETELSLLLRAVGCELHDGKSAKSADLELIGEAFSELAGRRGPLVSCRARVELKVRDRATGRILVTDRQTSVAIDVGEQIAAKEALAQAAVELASRVIPQVVR